MTFSSKLVLWVIAILMAILLFTPWGAKAVFGWDYSMKKARDSMQYETRKSVEDTCRAMQASYKSDVLVWEQYKGSAGESLGWAQQAKMRANKTAASYNQFVLKNSFVFSGNVPDDILMVMPYLDK